MQSLDDYRRENPWTICNVQNSIAECYGGAIQVSDTMRVVYVSSIPLLQ